MEKVLIIFLCNGEKKIVSHFGLSGRDGQDVVERGGQPNFSICTPPPRPVVSSARKGKNAFLVVERRFFGAFLGLFW